MNDEKQFKIRQIKILALVVTACGLMLFSFQNCSSGIRLLQNSTSPSNAGERNDLFNEAINSSINNMRETEKIVFNKESNAARAPSAEEKLTSEDAQVYLGFKQQKIEVQKQITEEPVEPAK